MSTAICKKTYIRVPPQAHRNFLSKVARAVVGSLLFPFYSHLARWRASPVPNFGAESGLCLINGPSQSHDVDRAPYALVCWYCSGWSPKCVLKS